MTISARTLQPLVVGSLEAKRLVDMIRFCRLREGDAPTARRRDMYRTLGNHIQACADEIAD